MTVAPDYAQIASGVTTRGKTVKEASDANSKTMAAIIKALLDSGVAQNDIQTSRFSVQPVYLPQEPRTEPKLAGYSVSNQVRAKIRQIDKLGRDSRSFDHGGCDRRREHRILGVRPIKSARSGARSRDRRCATQGRGLCACSRHPARTGRMDHGAARIWSGGSVSGTRRFGRARGGRADCDRRRHVGSHGHGRLHDCPLRRLGSSSRLFVMAGLGPAIHVFIGAALKTWMPGTRPGMTPRLTGHGHPRPHSGPRTDVDARHKAGHDGEGTLKRAEE